MIENDFEKPRTTQGLPQKETLVTTEAHHLSMGVVYGDSFAEQLNWDWPAVRMVMVQPNAPS